MSDSYDAIVIGSGTLTRDGQVRLTYRATNAEPRKRLYHNGLRVGDHLLERLGAKPTAREAAGAI